VQTAEGALTETHSILQRMRDLSVQAANSGSLNDEAKGNIQSELSQLKNELNRISDTTTFNGTKLLDGSYNAKFQVGANSGETISVNVSTDMSAAGLGVDGVDVRLATASGALTSAHTAAVPGTSASQELVGTGDFTLAETFETLNGTLTMGGKSLDLSTISYEAGATATQRNTTVQDAVDRTFGAGAVTVTNTAAGLQFDSTDPGATATAEEIAAVNLTFTAASGAEDGITAITDAIRIVSTTRADLGAIQNRFDHTINNLNVTVENLTASESRIRDADMAQEMVQFTRNQILSQAGTAMLAQANQASQGVLSLLR
jgi:flagellin